MRRDLGAAWAAYVADRVLLILTFPWLLIRLLLHLEVERVPPELYVPVTWPPWLLFGGGPGGVGWYLLLAATTAAVVAVLARPRWVAARIVLALGAVLLIASEFNVKVDHPNHLFLLAHIYAVFLPIGRPTPDSARIQAEIGAWYRSGLLVIYTMAGLWKFVDMTIRRVLKPGMSWLDPDSMVITSVVQYRGLDLPLDAAHTLNRFNELLPIGYVALAFVFAAAVLAAWRRPLIALVLPTILLFHLGNVYMIHVRFVTTCVVALAVLLPYDRIVPSLRRRLRPSATRFEGHGGSARYVRTHHDGSEDVFVGFFAYRARLADASWLLAAPLYYPGFGWLGRHLSAAPTAL